jgi:hypothetical protein
VRVGADVYSLYAVNDAITHEYEFGDGDHMASSRKPLDWFRYQIGMQSFRAFAEGKATWILNYSWDGDKKVDAREAMQNLFMSEIMAGANVWDAATHVMSGSNDLETRKKVFAWIAEHERTFYAPRHPIDPVGVYFSPTTRNYYTKDYLTSYQGILLMLMQAHREYQIVTPRTLGAFQGKTLVLPNVRVLSEKEREELGRFAKEGKIVVISAGPEGLSDLPHVRRMNDDVGARYLGRASADLEHAADDQANEFVNSLGGDSVAVKVSPMLAAQIAEVDGKVHVFIANFRGLRGGENPVQTPETGGSVTLRGRMQGHFLPFLGEERRIPGKFENGVTRFELPEIHRGAVVWFEPTAP